MQVKVNYLSTFNSNETVQPTSDHLESKKEVLPIIIVFKSTKTAKQFSHFSHRVKTVIHYVSENFNSYAIIHFE